MRDTFWLYYVELKHQTYYYQQYRMFCRHLTNTYSGFLMLASAAGIVTLSYWDAVPVLWSIIVLSAQVLQTLKPLLQAPARYNALKYILEELDRTADEMAQYWHEIDGKSEQEIQKAIFDFQCSESSYFKRFAPDLDFPFSKRCDKRAKEYNARYFWYHYGAKIEEVYSEQLKQETTQAAKLGENSPQNNK